MAQWEAKLATLVEAFDRFMVMERESPTVSGQFPHAPAPPVVADDAATTPAMPRMKPDTVEAPGSPPPGSLRRLHEERFEAKVGDWTAFTRCFRAVYESLDWVESDALRALPTALDDDALAAFYSISVKVCSLLAGAFAAMQDIYEPRSVAKRKFQLRKWEDTESPLTYGSALLALGQAAYPAMDQAALNSLAQEKLLLMAKELRVVLSLPSNSDDDMSSLQIARNIKTNLDLCDELTAVVAQPLVVCTSRARCPVELEESGSLAAVAGLPLASLPRRPEMYGGGAPRTC
ncbi:unnamed protein product [Lampetra fluviatilis]